MRTTITEQIRRVQNGEHLTREETRETFASMMAGALEPQWTAALICALKTKGEHVDELVGAAEAMRHAAKRVRCDRPCIDTCGTGGDGISTFNVSTTAAIIAAAGGAVVAKHGNRTNTRVSGSSEVLNELGVNLEADIPVLERCLDRCNLAFMHAPHLHPAMVHAVPVRKAIAARTMFNLLGPLANPAGTEFQILGVSRHEHLELMASALNKLGAKRVWVVHGEDGLCDLTITGKTHICELRDGAVKMHTVQPKDVGLTVAPLEELIVGSPSESAACVRAILNKEHGPKRDHAVLNAAAALTVYGVTETLSEGVQLAIQMIDSGKAQEKLAQVAKESHT
ncbi:MAG: anthranilate phosphoribosyltransferase [Phycisphaerae bacterium]|nr:MAG: anthranilate phosphoribosyltransferase [Phycisphaerae bacterium]